MTPPPTSTRSAPRSPAPTDTTRARAPKGEGDALRDELLDAAEALLIEHGAMDAVSIRAITTAVGVTPPALYLHFADKDELFFHVCERRFAEFEQALLAARASAPDNDPVAQLRALGRAYVRYGVDRAQHYELIFGPQCARVVGDRDITQGPGLRAFGLVVQAIHAGIESGVFRTEDPWLTSMAMWAAAHGAVMALFAKSALSDQFPMPSPEQLADHLIETLLAGLTAPAG